MLVVMGSRAPVQSHLPEGEQINKAGKRLLAEVARTEGRRTVRDERTEGGTFALCGPWRSRDVCWGRHYEKLPQAEGKQRFQANLRYDHV